VNANLAKKLRSMLVLSLMCVKSVLMTAK